MQVEATLNGDKLHDFTHWGLRASIGVIFIVHSLKKFDPGWQEWLISIGLPPELQLPIALAELIGGILLVVGVLTRISASIFFNNSTWRDISHQVGEWVFGLRRWMGMGPCNVSSGFINYCCRTWKSLHCTCY